MMADLRGEIIAAFSKVPHPGDDNLTSCTCDECQFEVSGFRGRTWMRLATEGPRGDFGVEANLSGLTLPAYHYFLPGLLLLALDDSDVLLSGIVDRLTASDRQPEADRAPVDRLVRRLSERQRQILIAVITHLGSSQDLPVVVESVVANLRQGFVTPYSHEAAYDYLAEKYGSRMFPRPPTEKGPGDGRAESL